MLACTLDENVGDTGDCLCCNMLYLLPFRLWPRPKDTFGSWCVLAMIELARIDAGNVLSAKCFNLSVLVLVWTNLWNIELQGEEKDKCQQILWPDLWHSKGSENHLGVFFIFVSTVRTWNYFKFQDMKRHFERFLNFAVEGWLRPQLEAMGKSVIVHLMRWLQECQRTDLWFKKSPAAGHGLLLFWRVLRGSYIDLQPPLWAPKNSPKCGLPESRCFSCVFKARITSWSNESRNSYQSKVPLL